MRRTCHETLQCKKYGETARLAIVKTRRCHANLFGGFKAAAFVSAVTTVFVQRNFNIRLFQRAIMGQTETDVLDVKPTLNPHTLIISLNVENRISHEFLGRVMIEIGGAEVGWQVVFFHHALGVGEKEVGVGLEMYKSSIHQKTAIAFHEESGREAFARVFHLRVRECEPNLPHLASREKTIYNLNVGAKERHVGQAKPQSLLGACPHARPFYIHADEIDVWIEPAQAHGVFPLAATQLQHDGVVVMKIGLAPSPLHVKGHALDDRMWILEDVSHLFHLRELG